MKSSIKKNKKNKKCFPVKRAGFYETWFYFNSHKLEFKSLAYEKWINSILFFDFSPSKLF